MIVVQQLRLFVLGRCNIGTFLSRLIAINVFCCASLVWCQAPATAPITDPAQITSKPKPTIQPFTIEKLYMTRSIGASSWSPDDKQVAFVSNISGRHNIWLVSSQSGWPAQ